METVDQKLAVFASADFWMDATNRRRAQEAAKQLDIPLLPSGTDETILNSYDYLLTFDGSGLHLAQGKTVIQVDFAHGAAMHRRLYGGGRGQMLAKAVGLKAGNIIPRVLDATAGLGRDAFVLATLGCTVDLCERVPLVRLLLEDGFRRASSDLSVGEIVARMSLHFQEAKAYLAACDSKNSPDVIYLDPMFPERRKKSVVKKEMVAFQDLVGTDADADDLLPVALEKARYRVVVKRPRLAPFLGNRKPDAVLEGDSVRFDLYTLRSMSVK